jgi:hypothetical protein
MEYRRSFVHVDAAADIVNTLAEGRQYGTYLTITYTSRDGIKRLADIIMNHLSCYPSI